MARNLSSHQASVQSFGSKILSEIDRTGKAANPNERLHSVFEWFGSGVTGGKYGGGGISGPTVKNRNAISSRSLRVIERVVGGSDQPGAGGRICGKCSDADRGCQMTTSGNLDIFNGLAQGLCHNHRAVHISLGQNQKQFVAAKTGRGVNCAQFLAEAGGKFAQRIITGVVTC